MKIYTILYLKGFNKSGLEVLKNETIRVLTQNQRVHNYNLVCVDLLLVSNKRYPFLNLSKQHI